MISDLQFRNEMLQQWQSLDQLAKKFNPRKHFVSGMIFQESGSPSESYNLLLVLAFSALDEYLSKCLDE